MLLLVVKLYYVNYCNYVYICICCMVHQTQRHPVSPFSASTCFPLKFLLPSPPLSHYPTIPPPLCRLAFFFSSHCFLPRCVCRESGWRQWRRPLHRSPQHRWWNSTGEWRGGGWTQSGPGDAAHDPGKHCFSSDHAGPTQPALTGKISMARSHFSWSHGL